MKLIHNFLFIVLVVFVFSCQKKKASIAGGYELEVGHTVSFESGTFEIHFNRVISDSRCPIGSNCEDLGQAIIELLIINDQEEIVYEFTSDDPAFKTRDFQTTLGKYEVKFVDLYPYPVLNEPLEEFQTIVVELKEL